MFDNIAGTLKGLARVVLVIGYISVGGGLLGAAYGYYIAIAVGFAALIACVFSSWFIYGFGELIESTQETSRLLRMGLSEGIAKEEKKRQEEEYAHAKAVQEARVKERERQMREESAKRARQEKYWQEHTEERHVLLEKRDKAKKALSAGNMATPQQQELLDLISSIDDELTKDR